jgi:hypothetical protein
MFRAVCFACLVVGASIRQTVVAGVACATACQSTGSKIELENSTSVVVIE